MGLTTGCAVCHDHKYDPISQKDFYALSAFFNNTTQNVRDGNISNTPPIIAVPLPEDRPRYATVLEEVAAAKEAVHARKAAARANFAAWLKTATPDEFAAQVPTQGLVFHAPLKEGKGSATTVSVDGKDREVKFDGGYDWAGARADKTKGAFTVRAGSAIELKDVGDFDRAQPFAVAAWVLVPKKNINGALVSRMDDGNAFRGWDVWLQGDRVGTHVVNSWPQDAVKVVAKAPLPVNKWTHITVAYDGTGKAGGITVYYNGVPQPTDVEADVLKSTTAHHGAVQDRPAEHHLARARRGARRPARLRPRLHRRRRATGVRLEAHGGRTRQAG